MKCDSQDVYSHGVLMCQWKKRGVHGHRSTKETLERKERGWVTFGTGSLGAGGGFVIGTMKCSSCGRIVSGLCYRRGCFPEGLVVWAVENHYLELVCSDTRVDSFTGAVLQCRSSLENR